MHYIKTPNGLKLNYEVHGEGEPILFIHGWGVNLRIWRQQIKHFSNFFKVIVIDLPGHGKSSWTKMSLADIASDLAYLLRSIGIEKIGIVGSSLGGLVALKIFSTSPEIVSFLVFAGSQPKFAKSSDYPYGLDVKRFKKMADHLESNYVSMINIFFRSLFTKQERATRRFKWIQTFRKTDFIPDKTALLELLDVLETEDLREVMEKINVPVQFINGTDDYICQKELYFSLQEKMPEARFDWFEESGHFPFLIKPHEFNKVLNDFIEKVNN